MQFVFSPKFKAFIISIIVLGLAGCGFHLRGDYSVPDQLQTLSVTSYDQYSTLTRLMENELRMNEVQLVSPSEYTPNLKLLRESVSSQTLSIYQNTRTAEVSITLNISYRVTIPNIGDKTFTTSVNRSYLSNPLTALAESVEEAMLVDEMRRLAVSQIVRQLARIKDSFPTEKSNQIDIDNNTSITTTQE